MLLVAADDWHPGVIGIVAGRLREKYRKPVVVVGVDRAANVGKGSGRSQPGVNLGRAVQQLDGRGIRVSRPRVDRTTLNQARSDEHGQRPALKASG